MITAPPEKNNYLDQRYKMLQISWFPADKRFKGHACEKGFQFFTIASQTAYIPLDDGMQHSRQNKK